MTTKQYRSNRIDRAARRAAAAAGRGGVDRRPVAEQVEQRVHMHAGHSHDPADLYPVASIRVPWMRQPVVTSPTPTPGPIPDPPVTEFPSPAVDGTVRINAGSPAAFTDLHRRTWSADQFVAGGTASTGAYEVTNTVNEPLFVARRFGNFNYSIPVDNGTHEVTLLFADPVETTIGARVFDVTAEGQTKLDNFDIVVEAGGQTAISKTFQVQVSDGTLNLGFVSVVDSAIVSGIQVVPQSVTPTPTPTTPTPTPTGQVPTNFTWKVGKTSPHNRTEGVAWVANGKMYTTGGFLNGALATTRDVDVYDPKTNAWSKAAPTPDTMTHAAAAVDGDTVWVSTFFLRDGVHSSRLVWKYSLSKNEWTQGPQLPQARGAGGLVIVGRELHAFGGLDVNQKGRTEHWRLDLDNPSAGWVTDTPLPEDNNHFGAAVVGGKIYLIGGMHDKVENLSNRTTVRIYDPSTRKWTLGAPLLLGVGHIGPTTFVAGGNKIIVAGGQPNDALDREVFTKKVQMYDPVLNKWTFLPDLPSARKSSNSGYIDGVLIVANGNQAASNPASNSVFVSALP